MLKKFKSLIFILVILILNCVRDKNLNYPTSPENTFDKSPVKILGYYFESETRLVIIFNKSVNDDALNKNIYSVSNNQIVNIEFAENKTKVILTLNTSATTGILITDKIKDNNGNQLKSTNFIVPEFDINRCVVINEIFPDAYQRDTNNDSITTNSSEDVFIELYNRSIYSVNVSNYKIIVENQYLSGGQVRHTFKKSLIIPPKGYLTVWGGGKPKGFSMPYDICNYTNNDNSKQYKLDLTTSYNAPKGSIVKLQNSAGIIIDQVGYGTQYGTGYGNFMLVSKAMIRFPDGANNFIEAVYPLKPFTPQASNVQYVK